MTNCRKWDKDKFIQRGSKKPYTIDSVKKGLKNIHVSFWEPIHSSHYYVVDWGQVIMGPFMLINHSWFPKEINSPFPVFHADSFINPEMLQPRSSMVAGTGQKFWIVLQGIFLVESDNSQMPWETQEEETHYFMTSTKIYNGVRSKI